MLIVTTAIKETWGDDEEILFTGEWCKLYELKDIWSMRKSKTLPDPWSNRDRKYKAYLYTQEVFKKVIGPLSKELNEFHKLNYPIRFWEIMCEPWVKLLIDSTYHNWECISDLEGLNLSNKLKHIEIEPNFTKYIPNEMSDFEVMLVQDSWNHYIFSKIIRLRMSSIEINTIKDIANKNEDTESYNQQNFKRKILSSLYRFLLNRLQIFGRFFTKSNSIFISNPYLSKLDTIRLRIKLGIFPSTNIRPSFKDSPKYNILFRQRKLYSDKPLNEYESFLFNKILEQIPYSYLEGFHKLEDANRLNKWPSNPKAIVTAVDYFHDDLFRYYSAKCSVNGSKINLICHGGGGKYKYSDWQDIDFNICDNYFTWGWSEYFPEKCFKGFNVKNFGYKRTSNRDEKHLLHITLSMYRYLKGIDAMPSYEQYINEYTEDQIQFLNNLSPDIKKNTITKLSYNFQNNLKDRIKEKSNNINFATMMDDYNKLMTTAKIVVTTYNCTTPVEALSMNIPTIIFWRKNHSELSTSAIPYFKKLFDCGVFHNSPESAALMVEKVWDDVDYWWQSKEVQSACEEFRDWFCNDSHDRINKIAKFCKL